MRALGLVAGDTADDMIGAMGRLHEISPRDCRTWVERRFSVEQMLEGYVAAYSSILSRNQ